MSEKAVCEHSLGELFGDSLTSSLCVNIEKGTETWVATGMLVQQLESFTDAVVIRENDKPIGIVGGKDIISRLIENPTSEIFYNTKVEDIMEKRFPTVSKKSTLKELIDFWKNTRRAFAAVPNEFADYSCISAKKLLEIGKRCKTSVSISQIPKKDLIVFQKDSTVGNVLDLMMENNTRRLILEGTTKFINDRIILQKITDKLKCLKETPDFLQMSITDFAVEDSKTVSEDLKIDEISKIMYEMPHPCVMYDERIITPWDICLILLSEQITQYE